MRKIIIINLLILVTLSSCSNLSVKENGIIIENAWARPALQGNPSAVYFRIENNQKETEKLITVTSQVAEFNEIHLSSIVDGTMKMMEQEFVEIEPDQVLEFKPMSYHVMLVNLKKDLKLGDQFEISLTFEKFGEKNIIVEVKETE
ncbi:MAG: copper chaperone PCu(A)C [Anaerolineaceae bacterium]|nr:copper chaperone PCu(A)C [Anaerolineaceae bacterium]